MFKIFNFKDNPKYIEKIANGEKLSYIDIPINRISIIGGSGSGKSTLAELLSPKFVLPVIHLDAINYNSNWIQIDKNKRDSIILKKINNDKWIIDGNYNSTLKDRLDKADLIIWLDYSTFAHLKGVFKRIITGYKKERPDIPGCKERINFKFIKYTILYNKKKRPKIVKMLQNTPENKLLIFRKQCDLNKWLKCFTEDENILDNIK